MLRFIWTAMLLAFVSAAVAQVPTLEELAAPEDIKDATISPDGRYLAVISSVDGRRIALTRDLKSGGELVPVMWAEAGSDFSLAWCRWANVTRLLCGFTAAAQMQSFAYFTTRLAAVDADGKNSKELLTDAVFRRETFNEKVFDRLVDDPKQVLIRANFGLPRPIEEPQYLYTVDIYTGKHKQVMTGFQRRLWNLYSNGVGELKLADARGNHGGSLYKDSAGHSWLQFQPSNEIKLLSARKGDDDWQPLEKASAFIKSNPLTGLAVNATDGQAYGFGWNNDRMALWSFDLEDKAPPRLGFAHPSADVREVITDGMGKVIGVLYDQDRPAAQYFDESLITLMRSINKTLPNTFNVIRSISADHKVLVIRASSDVEAGRLYLYDSTVGKLTAIGAAYPKLSQPLATLRPIQYAAQDGKIIHGYLMTPPGKSTEKLPLIVMPHSGYDGRSVFEFDAFSQFLATRGYAVLTMNYRGSSGYGKEWLSAGQQDWSGIIYTDILDGARWAISQGIADAKHVCMIGRDFAGYTALLGAIRHPDIYRCVVSVGGHANLSEFVDRFRRSGMQMPAINGISFDVKSLKKLDSPVELAADVKSPVLLIHGTLDTRAPYSESEDMAKALARAGKAHKLVKLEKADFNLDRPGQRLQLFKEVEDFLAANLRDQ